MTIDTPKRLIEIDLPIKRISAHARREKSIRHGHISTLHIWWARRPLAACRAVLCAALWPDPADPRCPQSFRETAAAVVNGFSRAIRDSEQVQRLLAEYAGRFLTLERSPVDPGNPDHHEVLRYLLLDFIAQFAAWEASTDPHFLDTARRLTQAAHEALGGLPGTRPLVVDPFAGGGSIPLEALRIGADAFASDLNPVAVLLNKVVLEYIPRHGQRLADEVRKWGLWVKEQAEKEIAPFYPGASLPVHAYHPLPRKEIKRQADAKTWRLDGVKKEVPIAYLWARTVDCEGPGCGVRIPLMRSLWLAKKPGRSIALRLLVRPRGRDSDPDQSPIAFQIVEKHGAKWLLRESAPSRGRPSEIASTHISDFDPDSGTVRRGSATCPVCGYTTPVASVRTQLKARRGGADDALLLAVVTSLTTRRYATRRDQTTDWDETGRFYRLPTYTDQEACRAASAELQRRIGRDTDRIAMVPEEPLPLMSGVFNAPIYGMDSWGSLFTPRQLLSLTTFARLVRSLDRRDAATQSTPHAPANADSTASEHEFDVAVKTCLALAVSRQTDYTTSLCSWHVTGEKVNHTFGRQALPMVWDFTEVFPFSGSTGEFDGAVEWVIKVLETNCCLSFGGHVERASAVSHPLPDDAAQCFCTDPPYYNAVPYADLSDFFYVWLRRALYELDPATFSRPLSPKDDEICEMSGWDPMRYPEKTGPWFQAKMQSAMAEGRRVLDSSGVGVVVFAHKSTSGWEAQLQAMVDAGWMITGSWPIDTEMGSRLRAMNSAALASSVHLVCRPRPSVEGSPRETAVGEWREVLAELPRRIHEWMPRLSREGIVGADAIFACLGPALEIFSRHERVEKASGERVTLREYLEQVWAAVSQEALRLVFEGADASGFEADARLTAMWLWTLSTRPENGGASHTEDDEEASDGDTGGGGKRAASGYTLEFDTARKIAQGLGASLESLGDVVALKGETARLLPVAERTRILFGKHEGDIPAQRRKKSAIQLGLFEETDDAETVDGGWGEKGVPRLGDTTLDRLHQAMILFAAGRSDAMRRFLVDEGVGRDGRFWTLAQAMSALYPPGSEEKRWVDGVLARKKGLGF